jgi:hypothetical protein
VTRHLPTRQAVERCRRQIDNFHHFQDLVARLIEAGCKTLIGRRLKQSGMFWSVAGANAIIALRCCLASGRFEQFWEDSA